MAQPPAQAARSIRCIRCSSPMPSATGHRCFSADSSPLHRRSIAAMGGVDADIARRRSGCSLQVEKRSQVGDMAVMCQEVSFPQRLEVNPEESACPPH